MHVIKNIRLLIAIACISSCSLKAEDLIVSIDSLVKIVNEDSECRIATGSWRNINDTCQCCIIKNAHDVFRGKKKAKDVVNKCLAEGKCGGTSSAMQGLALDNEQACQNMIRDIFNSAVVVKNVSLSTGLDKNGNLTEQSAKGLLAQAFNEGKLKDQDFKHVNCLTIKDMVSEKSEAPWGTVQLFLIESSCGGRNKSFFILKEMKEAEGKEGEIYKLVKGATYQPLEPIIYPQSIEGLPTLVFPIAYVSYKDHKEKRRYLSLMRAAPGRALAFYLKKFANDPGNPNNIRAVSQAYFDVGTAMARFYQNYQEVGSDQTSLGKSIAHGDLHAGNVFYDDRDRGVFLIDNERIAKSTDKRDSICEDIAFLLIKSLFIAKWVNTLKKDFPYKEWFEVVVPSYIAGVLSTYPKADTQNVLRAIEQCVKTYGYTDKESNKVKVWYTDKELGVAPKTYMDPLFERLHKWFNKGRYIASDIDINAQDNGGKTLLYAAAEDERLLMWPLIAAGANVNARDKDQNVPLHDAAWFNKPNAIRVLVDAQADINAQDRNGSTPLDKAEMNGSTEAIQELIKSGALRGKDI